jgi:hypothetical protein
MIESRPYLGVALKDGILTTIDLVESGLGCHCLCPACGASLVAKKGQVRQHHFAHQAAPECRYGPETVAHLMAKEILAQTKSLTVPPVYWRPGTGYILHPYKDVRFSEARVENRLGEIVPDLILRTPRDRELFVEIVVSHKASQEKIHKLVSMGTSAVELYLPRCQVLTHKEVRQALHTTGGKKLWLYNAQAGSRRRIILGADGDGPHLSYSQVPRYYAYFPVEILQQAQGLKGEVPF